MLQSKVIGHGATRSVFLKPRRYNVIGRAGWSPFIIPSEIVSEVKNAVESIQTHNAPSVKWTKDDLSAAIKQDGFVDEVIVNQDDKTVKAITSDGVEHEVQAKNVSGEMLESLLDNGVRVKYESFMKSLQEGFYGVYMFVFLFVTGMILYNIFANRSGGGGANGMGGLQQFMQSTAKQIDGEKVGVTFEDIAGVDYAKAELQEIVDFLKNPEKYSRVGAKIPKGCLLVGPSGGGKTILAKAVAGTAGVPFFYASASEFVQMFVGVGSSRVRGIFAKAKEKAPCIIFIDEIDAIGKARAMQNITGNDEREQTINQLLTEMDGFETNRGIIVIGATNRADILDKALLRPGRFDRIVHLDLPDMTGREAILKVHTRGKPLDDSVNLTALSKITAGFSGAELENLANEAAISAARANRERINSDDFDHALEKITMGPEKTSKLISEEKKRIVAVHESGHTITAMSVGEYDQVRKVTIVPRGSAGGVTLFEPSQDRVDSGLVTRAYLENQLVVALGGRAAEEIVFGEGNITNGASGDMQHVYNIAKTMIVRYGFSESLGNISWEDYSPQTAEKIDEEMRSMVEKAYKRSKNIIKNKYGDLQKLTNALLERETLDYDDIKELLKTS